MLSLVHVIEWRAATQPDAVALSDDRGGELTYAGLAAAMERAAAGFAATGIRPGDVVPVVARNQAGWVTAMFGLIRAGALPAAVNWRLTGPEVSGLLRVLEPAAVVTDRDCNAVAAGAAAAMGSPVPVLADLGAVTADGTPPARPAERLRGPEPAILVHTSGTTGRPKLVPLTHQQLIAAAVFMNLEVPEAAPGARHLSALPLFHVAGLANLSYVLFTGGHLHLLGGFDPAGFVDELAGRKIQLTQLVPTLIQAVTAEVAGRAEPPDLSHLTEVVYGASPIRPDVLERAVTTLGCRFRQNYASSETGPLPISSLPPADHDPARGRLATAGRPSLGWEVRLGEQGEIQVRGAVPAARLLARPGGHQRDADRGRLLPHRRRRRAGRRRVPDHRRPPQRRRDQRWRERVPGRGRGGAGPAPRCRRRGGDRDPARKVGRDRARGRGARAWTRPCLARRAGRNGPAWTRMS